MRLREMLSLDRHNASRLARRGREADVATRSEWFRACLAAWLVMIGAALAAAPVLQDTEFTGKLAIALILGFPVCYYVHGSRISRLLMNWLVFGVSVGLGALEVLTHWPYRTEADAVVGPVAILLRFFLWVMVFRAFAVRTLTDAVQTVIPAVSVLLLVLIIQPEPLALLGLALVALGTLALLAREHQALDTAESDEIIRVRVGARDTQRKRGRPSVYSWPTLYLAVVIVAVLTGSAASYLHFSSQLGQDVQIMLARKLAMLMIRDTSGYLPDTRVLLDGRTPRNSDRVIFRVTGEIPVSWRYTAYELYTGRTWGKMHYRGDKAARDTHGWLLATDRMDGLYSPATVKTRYEFTADAPLGGSLPVALWPTRLEAPIRGVRTDDVGTLMVTGYIAPGQSYTIEAAVPTLSAVGRQTAKPVLSEAMRARCLALPSCVTDRVRELAHSLADGETTPLGKISAIQAYLSHNFPYDLSPPITDPGVDFVDHFLFIGKRGYCHHFASAMAIMCRCVGLPARLAVGFTEGDYNADRDRYTVREKDAHSWTEVFLPDRGWMSFDPTPPEEDRSSNIFAATWKSLLNLAKQMRTTAERYQGELAPFLLPMLLVLVIGICGVILRSRQRHWAVRHLGNGRRRRGIFGRWLARERGLDAAQLAELERLARIEEIRKRCRFTYQQMRRWFAHYVQPNNPAFAPLEYAGYVGELRPILKDDAQEIVAAYIAARFSPAELPESVAETAEASLARVRQVLRSKGHGKTPVV